MNIGLVVHHFDRADGTGGYTVELLERFAASHDVTLYAGAVRAPVPNGVQVVRVPSLGGSAYARILSFPLAFRAVRRRHDVVHAQGWVTGDADVVTTHIVLAAWRAAARRAGVVAPAGERFLGGFVAARERALVRRARAVIAPSKQVKADIARLYGRDEGVHVVPHGFPALDLTGGSSTSGRGGVSGAEARARFDLPRDHFVALYVGDARKGLNATLGAIATTPGVHLLVLSGSSRSEFLSHAKALLIADRVHWIGHLADPSPAYAAADVLVHPTIYDTFALVVAEAMARGLPVIVSRAAGVSELLKHKISAWLLDSGSAAETAEAIATLAREPEVRRRLGEGALEVAARRTWDDVADETLAVYHTIHG